MVSANPSILQGSIFAVAKELLPTPLFLIQSIQRYFTHVTGRGNLHPRPQEMDQVDQGRVHDSLERYVLGGKEAAQLPDHGEVQVSQIRSPAYFPVYSARMGSTFFPSITQKCVRANSFGDDGQKVYLGWLNGCKKNLYIFHLSPI